MATSASLQARAQQLFSDMRLTAKRLPSSESIEQHRQDMREVLSQNEALTQMQKADKDAIARLEENRRSLEAFRRIDIGRRTEETASRCDDDEMSGGGSRPPHYGADVQRALDLCHGDEQQLLFYVNYAVVVHESKKYRMALEEAGLKVGDLVSFFLFSDDASDADSRIHGIGEVLPFSCPGFALQVHVKLFGVPKDALNASYDYKSGIHTTRLCPYTSGLTRITKEAVVDKFAAFSTPYNLEELGRFHRMASERQEEFDRRVSFGTRRKLQTTFPDLYDELE